MTDRWSNPSGGLGVHRYRVWPAGTDSYDHSELVANLDKIDAMIGIPSGGGDWPPTEGVNGGIYALIKDLQDGGLTLTDISAAGPIASRGSAVTRGEGFWYLATDQNGGTLYRSNGLTWDQVASSVFTPGELVTVTEFRALTPANNQEVTVVDSKTAPTFRWRFIYNANNAGNYKWEFTGGTNLQAMDVSELNTVGSTWSAVGPSVVVPLAGIYQIDFDIGMLSIDLTGALGNRDSLGGIMSTGVTPLSQETLVTGAEKTPSFMSGITTRTVPRGDTFAVGVRGNSAEIKCRSSFRSLRVLPVSVNQS